MGRCLTSLDAVPLPAHPPREYVRVPAQRRLLAAAETPCSGHGSPPGTRQTSVCPLSPRGKRPLMKSLHACAIVHAGGCLSCRQGNSLPSPGQAIRAPAVAPPGRLSRGAASSAWPPLVNARGSRGSFPGSPMDPESPCSYGRSVICSRRRRAFVRASEEEAGVAIAPVERAVGDSPSSSGGARLPQTGSGGFARQGKRRSSSARRW